MELLGIKREQIIIVNDPIKCRSVYVPKTSNDLCIYTSAWKDWADETALKVKCCSEKIEKIYVSRMQLLQRRIFGEEKIQKIFEQNGFKIIYPETLSLIEQIALVKNCKVLAGCAGTALHLALFMKSGGTVIQIKRNSKLVDNLLAQYLIDCTKDLNTIVINASIETKPSEHFSSMPQIIGLNENIKQFFKEYSYDYNKNISNEFSIDIDKYKYNLEIWEKQNIRTLKDKIKYKLNILKR